MTKVRIAIGVFLQHGKNPRQGIDTAKFSDAEGREKSNAWALIGKQMKEAVVSGSEMAITEDFGGLGTHLGIGIAQQRVHWIERVAEQAGFGRL